MTSQFFFYSLWRGCASVVLRERILQPRQFILNSDNLNVGAQVAALEQGKDVFLAQRELLTRWLTGLVDNPLRGRILHIISTISAVKARGVSKASIFARSGYLEDQLARRVRNQTRLSIGIAIMLLVTAAAVVLWLVHDS